MSTLFETSAFEFESARGRGEISLLRRAGCGPAVAFLHGFGSIKEDYADMAPFHDGLSQREILAWDAPCFGASAFTHPENVDADLLVALAKDVLDAAGQRRVHLVGHSMGGLAALLFADRYPDRIASLTSIEGNLAPEDCFFSRRIHDFVGENEEDFLDWFRSRIARMPSRGYASYAARLPFVVDRRAVGPMFRSIVRHSDDGGLLARFLKLRCPRLFVHGEENAFLSYLGQLKGAGVEVLEVAQSGHFPMATNPQAMWTGLARFLRRAES